jgi:hypothetical protein
VRYGCELKGTNGQKFSPSTDWACGGPIIEREQIQIDPLTRHREPGDWSAQVWLPYRRAQGETPLIAAMRAYVASKFGNEVPDLENNHA